MYTVYKLNIITTMIGKVGVKSETEIIMISINFRFVSYDKDEGILIIHFLICYSASVRKKSYSF